MPPRPSQAYKDDILDAYVLPYAGAIGDDFLLQDDNTIPHRSRIMDDYLHFSAWSRSPDLSYRACLACFRKTYSCSQSSSSNPCHSCNCFARAISLTFDGTDN
ncbi:hypothetical protein AVEN_272378-1 [Araneus ventricosus]|uniref:Tc1-like transposase DDE domain-containing protein n=1 Tax=Araneus ventricosus TaxID=182803 RepID=A0A4Y2I0N3_ARAVE|nr:hypothetical protein AVEN_272378-1 [Araneus ventricosus]